MKQTLVPVLLACALLAGCGERGLPRCDAQDRQARRSEVETMPAPVRDSIRRAFTDENRILDLSLDQRDCQFHARVRVDSFVTTRYAIAQGMRLIRVLKENAPNETTPLPNSEGGDVGPGVYDYAVVFDRRGAQPATARRSGERSYWVRLTKPYGERQVSVSR